jgi:hypothetical protein
MTTRTWPPLAITLITPTHATLQAAHITVADIQAPTHLLHERCIDAARTQARIYKRPLTLTAPGPGGSYTMTIHPNGTIRQTGFTPTHTQGQHP